MLFNSLVFLVVFLPVTYTVFWLLPTASTRYVWLTITGYVFYGYWDARFCLLMAFSTMVSYLAGLGFLRWSSQRARRLCLIVPITIDLSLLAFFKYANFGIATAHDLMHAVGRDVALPHLNIILPIGISFYTFHTITYIVDSYRGIIRPTRNLFEFSAYVSLFSQLIAGPIVRFRQIEADLESLGRQDRHRWLQRGVSFFITGMVEKVLVADTLAGFVNEALAHYQSLSTVGAWLATVGYTFQLYFDFSGYSTMAVGLGYLFGLRLPRNFNSPYKATDPADLWRRWHISLSTLLRDYLYIPLGLSRRGAGHPYRNLMITMLLGGLWHGAGWTFVAFGGYHGLLLSLYRRFGARWDPLPVAFRRAATFVLVVIGLTIFRATDFTMAGHLLAAMFSVTPGGTVVDPWLFLLAILPAAAWSMFGPNPFEMNHEITATRRTLLTAQLAVCVAVIVGSRASPFLYFQF